MLLKYFGAMEMEKFVEIITFQGKEIVFLNLNGLNEEEQLTAIDETDKIFATKQNILNVTDVGNTTTTPAVKDKANELHQKHKDRIKAEAIIGVSGLKRMLAQRMNKDMYFAQNIDDAKNWIVKQ